jgi:DNA-binding transcriptional LysR family regulator
VFAERLGPVLDELVQARSAASDTTGQVRGRLRITASNAFGMRCLSPLLPAFCNAHPALELDLIFTESTLDLVAERVDVAVRIGNLQNSTLVAVPLLRIRYRVVASPGWVRAQANPPRDPRELRSTPCLCFAAAQGFRDRWQFAPVGGGEAVEILVRSRLVATNAMLLRESALAGLGPTLLADWMIGDDVASGALLDLFPDHVASIANLPTTAWVVYPDRNHVPAKVRVFIDFLRTAMQSSAGATHP